MKPDPKVPQFWVRDSEYHGRGSDVRIVYPDGYVECNTPGLDWDESFMSSADHGFSVEILKSYGHKFVFNIK